MIPRLNPELPLAASRWTALLFIFFMPLSTALMQIFLGLTILLLGLSGQYVRGFRLIIGNRFVQASLLLLGLVGIGVVYSGAGHEYGMERLEKYAKLLMAFFLFPLFVDDTWRKRGLMSFLLSMGLVLALIYAMVLGILDERPRDPFNGGSMIHYTLDGGFKSRIITSIFMAFTAYAFAVLAIYRRRFRPLLIPLALLTAGHVLLISSGLTGRVILFALFALFVVQAIGLRKGLLAFLVSAALALPLMYQFSDSFRERIGEAMKMATAMPEEEKLSLNYRLEFLYRGIREVRDNPWFGTGTGGILHRPDPAAPPELMNLHNQYLMVWGELGIVGLALLLYLFYAHWSGSRGLPPEQRRLSQGVLLTMAVGCLFNSLLLDSGESHFYFAFAVLYLYPSKTRPEERPDPA